MQVTPNDLTEAVKAALLAGLVPFVKASPGVGKSMIMQAIANEFNLQLIDIRLTQADPTDLQGFPMREGKRMYYAPLEILPLESDPLPKGKDGWLIFFDELSSAQPSIQAASYKVMLDRMVGQEHLHKHVMMAAAGNLESDKAITFRLSTAMQSRLVHFEMETSLDDWIPWARENNIDGRIVSFLRFKPALLHNFKPDHKDNTFACPRTWEFISKLLAKLKDPLSHISLAALAGTVGEGAAIEFQGFLEVFEKLPSIEAIEKNPDKIPLPEEPSILHALTALISHDKNFRKAPKLLPFITRMPAEFQVLTLRECIAKDQNIINDPLIESWKERYASVLAETP